MRTLESEIARIPSSEPFQLYQSLHEASAQMLPTDAFYICLYAAHEQRLFFPYNFDGQLYDGPVNIPLGNGPTSWVVRNREPFVLECDDRRVQDGGVSFGDSERCSQSAIHVPIMRWSGDSLYGVLSAQSYTPGVYGAFAVAYLQWLADRAGAAMDRTHNESDLRRQLAASEDLAADRWRQAIDMSDSFVCTLREIGAQAEMVRSLSSDAAEPLKRAAQKLAQCCYRAQTEASMFPLTGKSSSSSAQSLEASAIGSLTEREREVLGLLALGRTNRQIADELYVSADAVKFHCRNIFQKLNITSRHQTASIVAKLNARSPR